MLLHSEEEEGEGGCASRGELPVLLQLGRGNVLLPAREEEPSEQCEVADEELFTPSTSSSSSMVGSCLDNSFRILINSGFRITYTNKRDQLHSPTTTNHYLAGNAVGTFSRSTGSEISATDRKIFCKLLSRKAFSAAIPGVVALKRAVVLLWHFRLLHETMGGTLTQDVFLWVTSFPDDE